MVGVGDLLWHAITRSITPDSDCGELTSARLLGVDLRLELFSFPLCMATRNERSDHELATVLRNRCLTKSTLISPNNLSFINKLNGKHQADGDT
jgi:hypothetical protein